MGTADHLLRVVVEAADWRHEGSPPQGGATVAAGGARRSRRGDRGTLARIGHAVTGVVIVGGLRLGGCGFCYHVGGPFAVTSAGQWYYSHLAGNVKRQGNQSAARTTHPA